MNGRGLSRSVVLAITLGAAVSPFAQERPVSQGDVSPYVSVTDTGTVTRRLAGGASGPSPLEHVPGELLVRLKPGVSEEARARALSRVRTASSRQFRSVENLHHLKLGTGVSMRAAVRALVADSSVLYAEPNWVVRALGPPNDPSFASQWALENTGQTGGTVDADIDAPAAWNLATGSSSVVVAVIDTGVEYTHPDLAANMFRNAADCNANKVDDDGNGYVDDCYGIDTVNQDSDPLDDHDHGTHVAGTIGAVGNNGLGVAGVNWQVGILACKFLNGFGFGDTAGAIGCLDYIAVMKQAGVNVIASSNSWGGGLFSQALQDAIRVQREHGILFVAAAGNSGADNEVARMYPCSYELTNVICVAATSATDERAGFSNYGRGLVHIGAPGVAVLSTIRDGAYDTFSGTSMATPHVTGVAALLAAYDPGLDWKAIKNRLLAGGDPVSSLASTTISGRRLNAFGSLTCTGSINSRVRPGESSLYVGIGAAVRLAALNIACAQPAGEVAVTVTPGGQTVTLLDDGAGEDEAAGDGLYSGVWTPTTGGTFTLSFAGSDSVEVRVDPHLKPGFPVKTFATAGFFQLGPAIHTLVGNIDGDPQAEILLTGVAAGPLYAWNHDGTPVPGWPNFDVLGVAYPALGELTRATPGLEVFSAHYRADPDLLARSGSSAALPGWPRKSANYVASPASLADIDGDGRDEVFVKEQDGRLHAYRADGTVLGGWPTQTLFIEGEERHTAAIADLDGDGAPEIVTASGEMSVDVVMLVAYYRDGTMVPGFPVNFGGYTDTFPVVGDVDGDRSPEIVVAAPSIDGAAVLIYSSLGTLERTLAAAAGVFSGTAPALADLDGDGMPEIIVQTNGALDVWKGDGTTFPGWPQVWSTDESKGNSAPVVGDVDGDGEPDIIVTSLALGSNRDGSVRAYDRHGNLLAGFPKTLPIGFGAVPAIADLDGDGRNEIIVGRSARTDQEGYYPTVWAFDLGGGPHGPVLWGQFMGGPSHRGSLPTTFARNHVLWAADNLAQRWEIRGTTIVGGEGFAGPGPGWRATSYSRNGDGSAQLLWTKENLAHLWTINANGSFGGARGFLGPGTGWTASSYFHNADGSYVLLWTSNNLAHVWTINADHSFGGAFGLLGPGAGWTANSYSKSSDGSHKVLWSTSGLAHIWTITPALGWGGAVGLGGPAPGWRATSYHLNSDGSFQVAWTADNLAQIWTITASGGWGGALGLHGPGPSWTVESYWR